MRFNINNIEVANNETKYTGLRDNTKNSMYFPNSNNMTMRGMKTPVKYYGITNGKITDAGVAYPGQDFRVNGQHTLEIRKFQDSGKYLVGDQDITELVDRYNTKGWESLSEDEQDFYMSNYDKIRTFGSDGLEVVNMPQATITANKGKWHSKYGDMPYYNASASPYSQQGMSRVAKEIGSQPLELLNIPGAVSGETIKMLQGNDFNYMNVLPRSLNPNSTFHGGTGQQTSASEALNIQNPYGAFAVDAVTDPSLLFGMGKISSRMIPKKVVKHNDPFEFLDSKFDSYIPEPKKQYTGDYAKTREKNINRGYRKVLDQTYNLTGVKPSDAKLNWMIKPTYKGRELTPEEALTISNYTHGYDEDYNWILRNNENTTKGKDLRAYGKDIETLNNLIQENKLPANIEYVYRNLNDYKTSSGKMISELQPGDILDEKGFSSTSMDVKSFDKPYKLAIENPGGNKLSYLYPDAYGLTPYSENEALLPKGLRYEMTDRRTKEGHPIYKVLNPYMKAGVIGTAGTAAYMNQDGQYQKGGRYGVKKYQDGGIIDNSVLGKERTVTRHEAMKQGVYYGADGTPLTYWDSSSGKRMFNDVAKQYGLEGELKSDFEYKPIKQVSKPVEGFDNNDKAVKSEFNRSAYDEKMKKDFPMVMMNNNDITDHKGKTQEIKTDSKDQKVVNQSKPGDKFFNALLGIQEKVKPLTHEDKINNYTSKREEEYPSLPGEDYDNRAPYSYKSKPQKDASFLSGEMNTGNKPYEIGELNSLLKNAQREGRLEEVVVSLLRDEIISEVSLNLDQREVLKKIYDDLFGDKYKVKFGNLHGFKDRSDRERWLKETKNFNFETDPRNRMYMEYNGERIINPELQRKMIAGKMENGGLYTTLPRLPRNK